jgi:UDP-N-acetyl-D-mannosaminuronic acid dehydrogenase
MKAAVVGIGRVGLPLAIFFASKGVYTYGIDVDAKKIDMLREGKAPFREKGMEEALAKVNGKDFKATMDFSKIADSDYVVLTLGTPVDEHMNPDYTQLEAALGSMKQHFREGQTLVLRSTVSPGSTEYLKNFIEEKTTFKVGKDFYLVFCPERIAEGKAMEELEVLPEIVGSLDEESGKKAEELFKAMGKEVYRTSAINAELLKLFTNMYRYINFAVGNEFLVIADEWDANIHEIVELSNKNYPRGGPKIPGFTAGPCLFKDGFFLTSTIPFSDLISTAWKINENLPGHLINKAKKIKPLKGAKSVVLGMAFKANSDDDRLSLSHKIKKILKRESANVVTHDVYRDGPDFEAAIKDAEFLVMATPHNEYKKPLDWYRKHVKPGCVVIDVWNVFGKGSVIFRC